MDKKTVLVMQLLMTFMMALAMSGLMLLIALGPTTVWLAVWPKQFLIAWPIAFVLTTVTAPLSKMLAARLTRPALRPAQS